MGTVPFVVGVGIVPVPEVPVVPVAGVVAVVGVPEVDAVPLSGEPDVVVGLPGAGGVGEVPVLPGVELDVPVPGVGVPVPGVAPGEGWAPGDGWAALGVDDDGAGVALGRGDGPVFVPVAGVWEVPAVPELGAGCSGVVAGLGASCSAPRRGVPRTCDDHSVPPASAENGFTGLANVVATGATRPAPSATTGAPAATGGTNHLASCSGTVANSWPGLLGSS